MVIGDSFAFGYGVDTQEASRNQLEAGQGSGCLGYSMVHGVLLMEQLDSG